MKSIVNKEIPKAILVIIISLLTLVSGIIVLTSQTQTDYCYYYEGVSPATNEFYNFVSDQNGYSIEMVSPNRVEYSFYATESGLLGLDSIDRTTKNLINSLIFPIFILIIVIIGSVVMITHPYEKIQKEE